MTQEFEHIPQHIAIIMDGNGRWAKQLGKERLFGHQKGVESVNECVETAARIGVKYLTLYAFSTENWGRPEEEVKGLMSLIAEAIKTYGQSLLRNNIRLRVIGDRTALSQDIQDQIADIEQAEIKEVRMTLIMALNYSSRWEITEAVKKIVKSGVPYNQITENTIAENLCTNFAPDPDLLIRTSGEERLSNFLLWQLSYTELYFTPVLWPEFGSKELEKAIEQYNLRERRFGLTQ